MKDLIGKRSVIVAMVAIMTVVGVGKVLAQRPTRGFSGGRTASIRPGHVFSRPSNIHMGYNRSMYRPGHIGSINFGYRPYYTYYNYYRPFLGFRVNILPRGFYSLYFGPDQFYYAGGLFYRQYNDAYEVVAPPLGAEVKNLPAEAQQVVINGQNYYEFKGVYYTQKAYADGKVVYVVAGRDGVLNTNELVGPAYQIGDLIDQLPEGSRMVTIKNEKYYVSPDDVYYEEVSDGNRVRYKVIGKLL
jgi:hypothetical protein